MRRTSVALLAVLVQALGGSVVGAQAFPDTDCVLPQAEAREGVPNSILLGEDTREGGVIVVTGYSNGGAAAIAVPTARIRNNVLEVSWTETLRGVTAEEMPAGTLAAMELRLDFATLHLSADFARFNAPDITSLGFTCQPR